MAEIRVLGPVDVVGPDGEPVAIGGPRQRRLAAALALDPGLVVSDARLAEIVWPEGDAPPDPRNALQTYVSRLRSAGLVVERSGSGYTIPVESAELDARSFEQEVRTAERLGERGDADAGAVVLTAALDRWRGPAFGEFADDEWARGEATRLDELRVRSRERLAELTIVRGYPAEAIADLQALSTEHPLRDAPHRLLMLALDSTGDQAAALRVFQDFRTHLAEETGLEPSAEMVGLERQIVSGEAAAVRPAVPSRLGSYEVGEMIGEGAFGSIYRATQPSVGREVAIKVVRPELANDPQFVRRFEVEAQTVARLEHPHIVPLYDYWRDPSGAYLVMRYLAGGSAEQRLVQQGGWTVEQLGRLVDEIGAALAIAHDAGVLHRDVKPANVLFDEQGNSYLADFGIAAEVGSGAPTDLRSAGSPLYVSPEQIRDGEASPASDIYSFGVLLYELLTGQPPFADSDSVQALLNRKVRERVPSVTTARPDVPSAVDLVIQTATAADPVHRFQSMAELVLAFRSATTGLADSASSTVGGAVGERPRSAAAQTLIGLELEGVNPYKGLAAFDEADSADFHGRAELVDELAGRLGSSRFLVVTGPSGSGKSSVVKAGLLPRLRDQGAFVASIVPGLHPMDELETALLRVATGPTGALLQQLTTDERGLGRAVKTLLPDDGSELVLVVDQFEELFTITPPDRRDAFLAAVAAAVTDERSRLRVVCTLRADFYDRPLQHPMISELVRVNTAAVTPLTGEELDEAITRPAANVGVTVEPALVAELVAQATGQAAALPMLQYALTEMFERKSGGRMTLESYREVGGLTGALANRADEVFDDLTVDGQQQARRLFTRLVTPGEGTEDTRRRALRTELTGMDPEVVAAFGAARLLTFDNDPATREPTVEVAHEALIREWPRLRRWLDDDRDGLRVLRHLGQASAAWNASGRDTGELYRSGRLEAAEEHISGRTEDLSDLERGFLEASVQHREAEIAAEQRSSRRLRGLLVGVAVVAVLALVASVVAIQQRGQASDQRAVAEEQAELAREQADVARDQTRLAQEQTTLAEDRLITAEDAEAAALAAARQAETGRLVAEAKSLAATNPRAAMLLAVAAHERADTPETQGALLAALLDTGGVVSHLRWGSAYFDVEWLGDDRALAVAADRLELIDVVRGEVLDELPWEWVRTPSPLSSVTGIADASPGGDRVVVADSTGRVVLFSTRGILEPIWEVVLDEPAYAVSIGEGDLVAVADGRNHLTLIDSEGGVIASNRLDDSANIAEQTGELLDLAFLTEFYSGVPVFPSVRVLEDWVVVATGSFLHRVDRSTGEVDQTSLMVSDQIDGFPGFAQQILAGDGNEVTLLGFSTALPFDVSGSWEERLVVPPLEGVRGGATQVPTSGSPSGSDLFLGLIDGTISRFGPDGARVETISAGLGPIRSADVVPGGQSMVVAHDKGVTVMSLSGGAPLTESAHRPAQSYVLSISRDGHLVAAAPRGVVGEAVLADLRNGGRSVLPELDVGVTWGAVTIDSDEFVVDYFTDEGMPGMLAFSTPDGDLLRRGVFESTAQGASSYDPSPALGLLALARNVPREVEIYDWDSFTPTRTLPDPAEDPEMLITSVRFDETRGRLFVGSQDGTFDLYDVDTWNKIHLDILEGADIAAVHWSLDGTLLAAVTSDGTVTIRDGDSFEVLRTMVGALGLTNTFGEGSLLLSADNRLLLTNLDEAAQLWDVETGQQIGPSIPTVAGSLSGANRDADGLRLVTGTERSMLSWNLDVDSWKDTACRAAGSNLSEDEWIQWGPRDEDYRPVCPSAGSRDQ